MGWGQWVVGMRGSRHAAVVDRVVEVCPWEAVS